MPSLIQVISQLLTSRQSQAKRISKVCALTLKELGLTVGGNVFQLINSKGKHGWLVSLHVPERFAISPTDALALRLFLTRRLEAALGLKPKSMALVLSVSSEAKRLPFGESVVDAAWIKKRIPIWLNSAAKKDAKATPASQPGAMGQFSSSDPRTGVVSDLPPTLRPNAAAIGTAPKSPPAKEQEARLEQMLALMSDDEPYEVVEASMTDFDRALN